MDTWFVATMERLPGELKLVFIWTVKEFKTEAAAKSYAKDALNKGLQVEAGTLVGPQVHVPWGEAAAWAESAEAGLAPAGNPFGESRSGSVGDIGSAPWRI